MDVQQLIGEVARRHNVLVDRGDPIFVTVTLNELLLAEHLEKVRAAITHAERVAEQACVRQVENAKVLSAQLMNEGARHVTDQLRVAGSTVRLDLERLVRDSLASARAAAADSARSRRTRQWAAAVAVACACLAVGLAWLGLSG
jgi:predicted DNA-binding protein (UPF0278 family)